MTKEGRVVIGTTVPVDGAGVSDSEENGEVFDSRICKKAAEKPRPVEVVAGQIELREGSD